MVETNLVLLPGFDGTGELFRDFVQFLPPHIRPHIISYPEREILTLSAHAKIVLNQLPENPVILAESFSGLVALCLLSQYEVSVRGVIFCAGFARLPKRLLLRILSFLPRPDLMIHLAPVPLIRAFCTGNDSDLRLPRKIRDLLLRLGSGVITNRLELLAEGHTFNGQISAPCYYLQAKNDRLIPSHSVNWFEQHFTHFNIEQIDGPHFLLQTRPKECAQKMAAIIEGLKIPPTQDDCGLARECAKLDKAQEQALAEEGMSEEGHQWPTY